MFYCLFCFLGEVYSLGFILGKKKVTVLFPVTKCGDGGMVDT